ncbi:sensor histidine kinase [Paenibacillus ginsengarvi]|uniref:histidine kinase n=1 Tax=Paenibacillus ginsengarvi TaxID=400777 RepID=A0A3B0CN24_9BACL|nr:ATP-binding protein [Paenibacillus ginsengarvi]RKN86793.1 HAMP domain-containing protein [Paenibacillus ginsengarvi]
MRSRGVVVKLFAITALLFLVFYAIVLLSQLLFFEQFYEHHKLTVLGKKLKAFSQHYDEWRGDKDSVSREIAQFISKNKSQLSILTPEGKVLYDNPFRIVIREKDGHQVKVSLSTFASKARDLQAAKLKRGDRIEVEGFFEDEKARDWLYPVEIKKPGVKEIRGPDGIETPYPRERISGDITELLLPGLKQWNMRQGMLTLALEEWFPLSPAHAAVLQKGERVEEEWTDSWSGVRSFIAIQPIMRDGRVSELIFAFTSLQQISEAYDALQLFYIYIGIGGFILILLLSLVFSRFISKPIVSLNKVAQRMAKLDFSIQSPIRRNDEIGSLSYSLNSLSETLDTTLKELQLANEQLREDVEHKKRIENMQKEFVSDASHELKTPLSIVRGFAEGLRDGVGESKRERYVEVILDETEKMEELVKDMLELTKLESKSIKLKKSVFSVSELMEDIVDKLSHHLQDKNLKVVSVAANDPFVMADQGKIEQVLFNIMMNAIRHAVPDSEITVRIDNHGDMITVAIENEGEQIPEDQLDHIWERFYRVERSRNRKTGGTGLGLAIVKLILELHESRYGVRNTDSGVCFYMDLPSGSKL